MGEFLESTNENTTLSTTETQAISCIEKWIDTNTDATNTLIDTKFAAVAPALESEQVKEKETQKYLANVMTTVATFTDRPNKIPYGTGAGQLVCDRFVKKVLAKVDPDQAKTINSVYGTVNMYKKVAPTKKLTFKGSTLIGEIPREWSLLFFVDKKSCGHVGFFAWMQNGIPMIADANTKKWVTKRQLWPAEAEKMYFEQSYREKFLKKA